MPKSTNPFQSDQATLSIGDLIGILRYRWLPGVATGVIIATVVAFIMLMQAPVYQGQTTLMIETTRERVLGSMEDGMSNQSTSLSIALITHLERLRSRQLAEAVAAKLTPEQTAALVAPYLDSDAQELAPSPVGILRSSFEVKSQSNSPFLMLTGTHANPRVAAWIPNLYAETYIRYLTEMRSGSSQIAVTFLEEQVATAQEEVESGEESLQAYRQENNLISIEENQQVVSQELQTLNEALNEHQIRLVTIESQLGQIEEAGTDLDSLSRIPALAESESIEILINRLEALEQERDLLSRKYLRRHPAMIDNQNQKESLSRQLSAAVSRREATLKQTQNGIETETSILRKRIAEVETRARDLDQLAIQYKVHEREVESKRRTYERLIDRLNETLVTSQLDTSTLRTMDEATVPTIPIAPSKTKTIIAAGFLFVLCALGIPIGLELIDNRVRTFTDIDRVLQKPLLGDVRLIENEDSTEAKAKGVLGNQEEITEAFRNIYSNLHLKDAIPSTFTIMVSSTIPSEGKTFVAINLASIYARHNHKTVLIDTDLRRPSLARNLGVSNEKGLLSWLRSIPAGTPTDSNPLANPELGLTRITENLDLIPAGGSTKSPTEALSSNHLDILVSQLKEQYDLILFDTPPVGVFPDATILAEFTDTSIYVVRQKKVPRAAAKHGVTLLDKSRSPVMGVVLNGVTSNPAAGRGTYQDYGYGQYGAEYRYHYQKKYGKEYTSKS
tara:strand:- start:9573 stop:11765 length:2193 start_codon:yes stop_codon:yes gene_type:complete